MTALTMDRKTDQLGVPDEVDPSLLNFGVEANTTIYGGAIVAIDSSGYAVPASASSALRCVGRCERQAANTTAAGYGAAGALNVTVRQGVFFFNSSDASITAANFGQYCYAVDDNNVSLSDGGGTRPIAGLIFGVGEQGLYPTGVGQIAVGVGMTGPYASATSDGGTPAYKARAVITSLSGSYTGSTTGVLTASSAAAFGTQDGVSTLVVGDVVVLLEGTTNITAASDAGPYVISVIGSGTVKWVLTRPSWWETGITMQSDQGIDIGEGTLFACSTFRVHAVKGTVVDTGDPLLYPDKVTQAIVLSSGTHAITNVPILSATKSNCIIGYTSGGNASTVAYVQLTITPGALNTATVTITALSAYPSTTNAGDTAHLNVTIVN